MALQTLNTIKQWFKTGLKPSQQQFWDTWDSFRHKFEKVPVKDIEGIDELLLSKADKVVLDNHLANKIAHAPQVNTDWNSESGFSQLFNKPEFKTINGEPLTGGGDIVIEAGGAQNLQTTLGNGNETTNSIIFNDDYYNWLKTSIDSRSIRLTDSNSNLLAGIDSAGVFTHDDSQHVSINPQGIFFNRDTAESYLRINTSSTGVSTINLPVTEGTEITLAAKEDFKTINGEEIVGEGDITISSAIPTLDQVLNSDNKSLTQPIVFLNEEYSATIDSKNLSIDGPLEEVIQYNGDNINWSKADKNLKLIFDRESTGQNVFSFPEMPDSSTPYKLATDQVVSATQSGIVDNTPLQELGGEDKLINGIRVGAGNLQVVTNTVFGNNSLGSTITGGTNNTAIGRSVMPLATSAPANTGIGSFALNALTTGSSNVGIGASSLRTITTGSFNMGVGNSALGKLTTQSFNTAVGANAGGSVTGGKNTSIGYLANGSTSETATGEFNISLGYQANKDLTSGSNNVTIQSVNSGSELTSGNYNLIVKQGNVRPGIVTGNNNTIIGNVTGLNSDDSNLAIISDGNGNIAIRKEADNRLLAPTLTNALIDSGGAKSLVTKEYLDAHSEGSSQNLDEILDNGNIAIGKFIRLNEDPNLQTNSVDIKFDKTVYRDKQQGTPSTEYDKNSITKFDVVLQDVISDFDFSVGVGNFKLPVKTKGSDYTLATTDDITGGSQNLQQTIDNGGIAIVGNQLEGNKISYVAITDENIILNNNIVDLDISSGITMGNGTGLKLGYSKPSLGFTTIVEFEEPTKGNSLLFPDKSGTLATTSDFKTINGQSIVGTGDISVYDDNVLHKTGNEFKEGDLNITGNLGITGNIEITDMDTFPRPPETNIILNKNGDLKATNFIGRSITSFTGQFHSNVTIGTAGYNGSKLEVNGTISTNGINVAAALTESSDAIFNNTPVGSQRTIAGNTIQIAGATGDYFLETFRYNISDYGMQRITFTSTASAGRFFIRTVTAGVWSAWIEKQ
ncbi:pyocin knob domain-containing protein [Flavobacterium sp. CSZ]|uniref:pyocin knob domain-containing protein n=1 Tax=Flavobacterium sp. CSZ TaxID=2783791 RepID=UPI00188A4B65|nr:pyocin knob domain-containing protein [Flavobacterium sp. CSZ]MBF4484373.1 hypothetical protein [Flavobacterium sp. CSZ]